MIHLQLRNYVILVSGLVLLNITNGVNAGCTLKYATDFPDKESVVVWKTKNGYDLIEPSNDGLYFNAKQQIGVSCPGARNTIGIIGKNLTLATCVSGQTFKVGTTNHAFNELGCSISVTGEYMLSEETCGSGSVIKYLGHKIGEDFDILIEVCYDENAGGAVYADHIIYGSAINYARSMATRPSFKVAGVAAGVQPDNAYRQDVQKTTFATLLKSNTLANKYIYQNSYLARGHLAPDADMVYGTSQYSTYFYINTVPQWQQINNGNWKSLETSVRKLAANLEEDIEVFTGSHEVLSLKDAKNKLVDIYLSNGKLPVPKFIWKVFYSLNTSKGIAFVSVNNPFVEKVTSEYYLCKDICDQYAWGTSSWKNASRGLVYCCEINDLRRVIPTIPKLDVVGVQEADVDIRSLVNLFKKLKL